MSVDIADEVHRQVKQAMLKDLTVSELVSELRKRDGVDVLDATVNNRGWVTPDNFFEALKYKVASYDKGDKVTAIILRITD